jgi:hypothetical protein
VTHLRLAAEALAWPIVDPDGFVRSSTRLEQSELLAGFLPRAAELGATNRAESWARRSWPDDQDLGDYLLRVAGERLERLGPTTRLRADRQDAGEEILRWRWLSLTLPPGLLVAAATPLSARPTHRLELGSPGRLPSGPLAHQHLHLGAACSFEVLWAWLASLLPLRQLGRSDWSSPLPGVPWPDSESWTRWLIRAMLGRRLLARQVLGRPLPRLVGGRQVPAVGPAIAEIVHGKLANAVHTLRHPSEVTLRRLAVTTGNHKRRPRDLHDVWHSDPIGDGGDWPEGLLMQQALHRLPQGSRYRQLFFQYLRVKATLYRHLVADSARPGLSRFTQVYARLDPYTAGLEHLALQAVSDEPEIELQAIEVRSAPPKTLRSLLDQVTRRGAQPQGVRSRAPREWGWTWHFIRGRPRISGAIAAGNSSLRAARRGNLSHPGRRLAEQYRQHWRRCGLARRALERWPGLLSVVRALDVAGEEPEGPLWLAVPALKHLQRLSQELAGRDPGGRLIPLRMTLHVGEDYRSLWTGLRAVHEPFERGLLRPGDRLGHAVVLGERVSRWFLANPVVAQPRWERMEDLAWLLDAGGRFGLQVSSALPLAWRDELAELTCAIWRDVFPTRESAVEALRRLRRELGSPGLMAAVRPELDGWASARSL